MSILPPRFVPLPLATLAALAACSAVEGPDSSGPPVDPRWGSLISARTHGTVSSRDRVTIEFTRDVAGEHLLGQPTAGVLELEPAIDGTAVFTSARQLVFTPAAELPSGGTFRVTLAQEGLLGVPEDLSDYWFAFEVIEQDFEIWVDGLEAQAGGRTTSF